MCGLRTHPRTNVDRPRFLPPSNCQWRGHIVSTKPCLTYACGFTRLSVFLYLSSSIHTCPFNGPLSGTTRVSRYQKGKTNLDFTESRDSEWQWHQLGHMQVCTSLRTDNHASTPPLSFLQAGCPSCRPTNSVKALSSSIISYKSASRSLTELRVHLTRQTTRHALHVATSIQNTSDEIDFNIHVVLTFRPILASTYGII